MPRGACPPGASPCFPPPPQTQPAESDRTAPQREAEGLGGRTERKHRSGGPCLVCVLG